MTSRLGTPQTFVALSMVASILGACASVHPNRSPGGTAVEADDPLSAWSDTAVKRAIVDYVAEVTRRGGPDYISPQHRLATFDFDGTIGCEKPDYMEVMVAVSRLCERTETEPGLLQEELYRAACKGDLGPVDANVDEALLQAFSGAAQGVYADYVKAFVNTHRHPRFDRPYAELYYLPMLQLIDFLHANGFAVYVVSGSQQGFTRSYGTEVLGIAAPRLIGRTVGLDFSFIDGGSAFARREAFLPPSPDGRGKAEIIRNRIGQQPVFAFGNSMGDLEMLQYATSSRYPSLGLILVHDDPEEYVYRDQELIQNAARYGWQVVSMKDSFEVIFPE